MRTAPRPLRSEGAAPPSPPPSPPPFAPPSPPLSALDPSAAAAAGAALAFCFDGRSLPPLLTVFGCSAAARLARAASAARSDAGAIDGVLAFFLLCSASSSA
eukprot:2570363-Pleurochrysis_carterae.AAC.1